MKYNNISSSRVKKIKSECEKEHITMFENYKIKFEKHNCNFEYKFKRIQERQVAEQRRKNKKKIFGEEISIYPNECSYNTAKKNHNLKIFTHYCLKVYEQANGLYTVSICNDLIFQLYVSLCLFRLEILGTKKFCHDSILDLFFRTFTFRAGNLTNKFRGHDVTGFPIIFFLPFLLFIAPIKEGIAHSMWYNKWILGKDDFSLSNFQQLGLSITVLLVIALVAFFVFKNKKR